MFLHPSQAFSLDMKMLLNVNMIILVLKDFPPFSTVYGTGWMSPFTDEMKTVMGLKTADTYAALNSMSATFLAQVHVGLLISLF